MSALGLAALGVAQAALEAGVHGGQPSRFEGPEVNGYLAGVGLAPGYPWCAAFIRHCFEEAATQLGVPDPCPRTASALHLWTQAPEGSAVVPPRAGIGSPPAAAGVQYRPPAPGDVFVFVHPDGVHGHCGIVESVSPDGQTITTVEGDTNAEGSTTGDAVGRHTWTPAGGKRGRLIGYLEF